LPEVDAPPLSPQPFPEGGDINPLLLGPMEMLNGSLEISVQGQQSSTGIMIDPVGRIPLEGPLEGLYGGAQLVDHQASTLP